MSKKGPKIGVIGLGHWFNRLAEGLSDSAITVSKAMGRKSFSERADQLRALGINESNYYIGNPNGSIPKEFFNGIDAVYISSPNSRHYIEAMETLESGKYAIVEKTLATNEEDFNSIMAMIERKGYSAKTYLHLHYIHKQLTMKMDGILTRLAGRYGKVQAVSAAFLEKYTEEDGHRKWIFSMREGGIFMDWIHPYEILFHGAKADSVKLSDANPLIINSKFGSEDPSGIDATVTVNGSLFEKDAIAAIRVGKGADTDLKRFRFYFKGGIFAEFNFLNSNAEFSSPGRGTWSVVANGSGRREVLESGEPSGPDTSQLFASDIIEFCSGGKRVGLSTDEIRRLYQPQWDFQKMIKRKKPSADPKIISEFITSAKAGKVDRYGV